MNVNLLTKFEHYKDWAPVFLRVSLGLLFITHGYGKIFGTAGIGDFLMSLGIPQGIFSGIAGFTGYLEQLGVPGPGFFAVLIGLIEFVGGIGLLLGLFTRLSALFLAVEFAVVVVFVHIINFPLAGAGWESILPYLGGLLALLVMGPGMWSLENKIFGKVRF